MTDDLRLVVQQPALPRYRVPVFRALANEPGIDMRLIYADVPNLPNAEPDGFKARHTPVRSIRLPGGRNLLWNQAQIDHADPRYADVMILSWNLNVASLIPALIKAKRHGIPTVLWGHGYSKQDASWRSIPRRKVTSLATALLLYNHSIAKRYVEGGIDEARVHVALNAIDQTPIDAARRSWLERPDDLAAFRREHDLDDGPLLLFVSRITPIVRLDLLVKATALLAKHHPGVTVAVVGKGDSDAVAKLQAQAESLGVAKNIRFLGAIYGEDALAPWFLTARAFCYPEAIGLSLMHAFGYGLPVVTADDIASQNPEIEALRDDVNGVLYETGNVEALADVLRRVIDDEPYRDRLSAEALRTVHEEFSLPNMVAGMAGAVRWAAQNG